MTEDERLPDIEYLGIDPYSDRKSEVQINPQQARFILPREKRRKQYEALFDANLDEVVSFEVCIVHVCKDNKTWPADEELPEDYEPIGTAGLVYLFLMPFGKAFFPIWGIIPAEDVITVLDLLEKRLGRPSLPGLAHHGTAAAVRFIVDNCEVLGKKRAQWYDWSKKGRMAKPNKKFRERGPDYVYCKEGMAIDLYGTGEQLEQMSTFWPWRLIRRVFSDDYEFEVRYEWHEDAYTYRQQVLENEDRRDFCDKAESALEAYRASEDVDEMLLVRPRSFPSRFHKTWKELDAFSSKASRNRFPPIYDFVEEE